MLGLMVNHVIIWDILNAAKWYHFDQLVNKRQRICKSIISITSWQIDFISKQFNLNSLRRDLYFLRLIGFCNHIYPKVLLKLNHWCQSNMPPARVLLIVTSSMENIFTKPISQYLNRFRQNDIVFSRENCHTFPCVKMILLLSIPPRYICQLRYVCKQKTVNIEIDYFLTSWQTYFILKEFNVDWTISFWLDKCHSLLCHFYNRTNVP